MRLVAGLSLSLLIAFFAASGSAAAIGFAAVELAPLAATLVSVGAIILPVLFVR